MILVGALLALMAVIPTRWAFASNYRRFQVTQENSLTAGEAVATVAGLVMLAAGVVLLVIGILIAVAGAS